MARDEVRVVRDQAVARTKSIRGIFAEHDFHRVAYRAQVPWTANVICLRDHVSVAVKQGAGEIVRLPYHFGVRRLFERHAHLLGDRYETTPEDLQSNRV